MAMAVVRPQIVLLGDSITEQSFRRGGWGAALADSYSRKADIVVRGYGGYNTRWALLLLHHLWPIPFAGTAPAAVTIFFGANDAALLGRQSEKQHVPLPEYKHNLRQIVSHFKQMSPSILVLLIAPPPVDEDGREQYAKSLYGDKARKLPERTNEVTGTYARQCVELAQEMQIPCIDVWTVMQQTEGWQKLFLRDGLHLTEEGNAVVHSEVLRALNGAGLAAEEMQLDFPHHSAIDGAHPEKAFQSQGCSSSGNVDAFCPEIASNHI
ncbi:GDSL esterase/lipase [Rhynchospora pubera]|uniref:GDSL esterase/lipase n=1 Tax=Rhynchospora pubera TaxID=906938 RepID=A0AAV8DIM6_9POAL|nr:GDSL esterase/lipase [Rhynchospora pubera]